jgi:hypothetical protein
MTVVDAPDPGQPVLTGTGPLLTVTGWPTLDNSYGVPVSVPTETGQPALYAQSFGTATSFEVTQVGPGFLQLAWTAAGQVLESHIVHTVSDLNTIAAEPLVAGVSVGRIKPTGAGLPAPGVYPVNLLEPTIWNSEQAGGILLPVAHFLVLAKEYPGLVDAGTQAEWTSKILTIAAGYESIFVPDGQGGLRQHNPVWLPNAEADLDAPMDYISVEATLRLFLYELTGDPHQLAIADGLILHQRNFHWSISPQGWFPLQLWPDFVPWSSGANAPPGSVWDSFQYDPNTPAAVGDGSFFVDLLHYAKVFGIGELCLTDSIHSANRATFQEYLLYDPGSQNASEAPLRANYPILTSKASDAITPTPDPLAGEGFLTPEVADQSVVDSNWNWMQSFEQNYPGSVGYFLRSWARSEAAELNRCKYAGKLTPQ